MAKTAFLVKSFFKDLEKLRLLLMSIRAGNLDSLPVYLIVPRKESSLFEPLVFERVEVVFEEDLIKERYTQDFCYKDSRWRYLIRKNPILRRLQRRPCYFGDLVQQLCKLALPAALKDEVDNFIILDSDVVFIRSFKESDFVKGEGPLIIEEEMGPQWEETKMGLWIKSAKKYLGVEDTPFEPLNHIHHGTCWRSSTVSEMLERIEEVNLCHWQDALMSVRPRESWVKTEWTTDFFSEMELMGVYNRYLAKARQPVRNKPLCLNIWSREDYEEFAGLGREVLRSRLAGYMLFGLQKGFLSEHQRRATIEMVAEALGRGAK